MGRIARTRNKLCKKIYKYVKRQFSPAQNACNKVKEGRSFQGLKTFIYANKKTKPENAIHQEIIAKKLSETHLYKFNQQNNIPECNYDDKYYRTAYLKCYCLCTKIHIKKIALFIALLSAFLVISNFIAKILGYSKIDWNFELLFLVVDMGAIVSLAYGWFTNLLLLLDLSIKDIRIKNIVQNFGSLKF